MTTVGAWLSTPRPRKKKNQTDTTVSYDCNAMIFELKTKIVSNKMGTRHTHLTT